MADSPRILLLGPPGAGKGTQSARLADAYDVEHVTTGDALRANKDVETEYGTPRSFMEAGELVPDPVVNEIVAEALSDADGFVLDGYPRNLDQAEYLADITDLDHVVYLDVDEETLVERLTGRRVDPETGDNYHVEFDMPDDEAVRERLVQREDDAEETVRERLRVYRENTAPVVEHYRETGRLETVDGEGTPDEVFAAVRDVIEGDASGDGDGDGDEAA
jgi:adenylate kinase